VQISVRSTCSNIRKKIECILAKKLPIKDNLRIVDKKAYPNVSIIRRFHCNDCSCYNLNNIIR